MPDAVPESRIPSPGSPAFVADSPAYGSGSFSVPGDDRCRFRRSLNGDLYSPSTIINREVSMKFTLLIMLALFVVSGCARQEPAQMTPQEQEAAKKEIGEVLDHLLQAASTRDAEALMQSYSSSSDLILLTTEGSMVDYQAAKNGAAEMYKSLTALEFTTVKNEFRFLPDNTVICAWLGKCGITYMTGERATIDAYAITFVLKKLDNQWKIVYSHESASQPVLETPTK
jgi:ketosteroid isomerase-like protein